jgi:hypothetical protein
MAKSRGNSGGIGALLTIVGLIWDVVQADKHQRTCPQCAGRDYLSIALDVVHLAGMSLACEAT